MSCQRCALLRRLWRTVEIVVAAGEVRIQTIEIAGLLHAVTAKSARTNVNRLFVAWGIVWPNRIDLSWSAKCWRPASVLRARAVRREVGCRELGGFELERGARVEVALDHHCESATNHAIAVAPAKARLHPRDALVLCTSHRSSGESLVTTTGGLALKLTGTRCIRRTSKRTLRRRTHATMSEANEGHGPVGERGRVYSSHSTTVPWIWKKGRPAVVCQLWGLFKIKLLSVSRIFVFWPA